ncbi:MAG: glyceraldehyde 3-phosphate dehydrogenase NAD-binding domain-containing protein [bacterium]
MKKKKIAINGFGRIGRLLLRRLLEQTEEFEVVAINDLGDFENLAYLLQYDTVYGKYPEAVHIDGEYLVIGETCIKLLHVMNPTELPWGELDVDVAVESTGIFDSFEKANMHIAAGAKHVVITAPAKDEDGDLGKTVVMGVNEDAMGTCKVTSNGSCTTNAIASVVAVMEESVGVEKAVLNTIHSYTATQSIVDGIVKGHDFRRGRAAAQNISPSTTGAALALGRAIPTVQGKFDGIAIRVPAIVGSIADVTFLSKRKTSVEEINDILRKAAQDPRWNNVLAVTEEQIVSSDIVGSRYGAIVDLGFTKVVDGDLVKLLSWYDNESGYVSTLVQHIKMAGERV